MTANEEAARVLGAEHTIKLGHDHAYAEYIPAVAKQLANILK